MDLTFEDFAHHYRDSGMSETRQRDHFALVVDVLKFVAFGFWGFGPERETSLWMELAETLPALENGVESKGKLSTRFERAASGSAGGERT